MSMLDPLNHYFMLWSDDLDEGEVERMVKWCGGERGLIKKRAASELLKGKACDLFFKLREMGEINEVKCDVLIKLFSFINRGDLVDQVKARYEIGFDRDVSEEELKEYIRKKKAGTNVTQSIQDTNYVEADSSGAYGMSDGDHARGKRRRWPPQSAMDGLPFQPTDDGSQD
ncbi:uncharacterized protein [Ptychodera flava]|uniref:uncharacterized protein n=1 Tax=Ptychodera flava TaxID=63121 RepID=UPI003969BDE2